MVFSSLTFLFIFLPVTLLGYRLLPKKLRIGFLLLASLLFYAWGEPLYVFLMIGSILVNWGIGFKVTGDGPHRKAWLVLSVALNLLLLLIFKYTGLLWDTVKGLFPAPLSEKAVAIRLPIGISFFTFQIMSYVIDVYRGKAKAQKSPVLFGAYVSMFPQLIAGPIVRYVDIEAQLDDPDLSLSGFAQGVGLFVVGLGKKVLLANGVAVLWRELAAMPGETGVLGAWVGLIAYTFQIYFDFSGYSDMACGLGRMLGFRFVENFHYPYIAESVTDFWRRWHISLSTWFREYVYIPLGGNRRGLKRQILNLLIVWTLTGLWHGASWNFLLWGLYYVPGPGAPKAAPVPAAAADLPHRGPGLGYLLFHRFCRPGDLLRLPGGGGQSGPRHGPILGLGAGVRAAAPRLCGGVHAPRGGTGPAAVRKEGLALGAAPPGRGAVFAVPGGPGLPELQPVHLFPVLRG